MNGISVRSKRRPGNWMSSALPMVSALMPVLSERKNTCTTSPLSASVRAPVPLMVGHATARAPITLTGSTEP